jgi:hypothetical protein
MKFELRIEAHSRANGEPVFSAGVIGQSHALGVFDSDPALAAAEAVKRFFMAYPHELQTVHGQALSLRSVPEKA